jgi:glycosyltransferase involved in cell wall biosynthesis
MPRATKNLTICIAAPPYKAIPTDGYGGIEKVSYERASELKKLGFKITIIAPEQSRVPFADKVVYVKPMAVSDFAQSGNKTVDYLRFLDHSKAFHYFKRYLPFRNDDYGDIVINDAFRNEIWNSLIMGRIFGESRTINVLHANMPAWTNLSLPLLGRKLIFGALSRHVVDHLCSRKYKAFHFPNGIAFPPKNAISKEPDDYLVFLGKIMPIKGVHIAIRLAKLVHKRIFIIGPVGDQRYFRNAVKPHVDGKTVVYVGEKERTVALRQYLKKALALVFSSVISDAYPTVLLEALSYGVPVVATRPGYYSGFYDILNPGNSVIGRNIHELSETFHKAKSLDRTQIYEEAKSRVSWEPIINTEYVPVFEELSSQ